MSLIPFPGDESDNARFVAGLQGNARMLLQYVSDTAVENALAHIRADQGQAAAAVHALFAQSEANRQAGHEAIMRVGAQSEENLLQLINWAQLNYASKLEEARLATAASIQQQQIAIKDTALKASAHVENTRVELEHKLALVENEAKRQVFSVHEHVERKSLDSDKAAAEALRVIYSRLNDLESQMAIQLEGERSRSTSSVNELRGSLQKRILTLEDGCVNLEHKFNTAQASFASSLTRVDNACSMKCENLKTELGNQISTLEAQLAREKNLNSTFVSRLNTAVADIQALQSKIEDQEARVSQALSTARACVEKVRGIEKETAELKKKLTDDSRADALSQSATDNEKRVNELTAAISTVKKELENLRSGMAALVAPSNDDEEDENHLHLLDEFNERYADFTRQIAEKMEEFRSLVKEKRLSESRELPMQQSAFAPFSSSKSPRARDPRKRIEDSSSCSSCDDNPLPARETSSHPADDPRLFDCGSTMKAVARKGWLDTRKKDVYLFEHAVGSAIARFQAHYNVPFQGEGLANQIHANLIQRVATRFGGEDNDRKLTEELFEIIKRERYTNEALTQAIIKPEFGRQTLCELLVALTSPDPVGTMNIFRRARAPTLAVDSATFSAEAAGTATLRLRVPVLGECEQRLTACFDRLFQKEKTGAPARGSRGGKKTKNDEEAKAKNAQ